MLYCVRVIVKSRGKTKRKWLQRMSECYHSREMDLASHLESRLIQSNLAKTKIAEKRYENLGKDTLQLIRKIYQPCVSMLQESS